MTTNSITRRTFSELARSRQRGSVGPLKVAYVETGSRDVRVAYAISTKVGGAVVRNRLRRRLRAAVALISESMPGGVYLVSVRSEACGLEWRELCATLNVAVVKATRR
jgi:ribonuclease P protein component